MATEGMGFTRMRDLVTVTVVAAVAGFLLVQISYSRFPALPRLAGLAAAVLGIAEALLGLALRSRINAPLDESGRRTRPPVPPLVAARAVMAAKATSLAGAALGGLWIGLALYVIPKASQIQAAQADLPTSLVGLAGAIVMVAGALFCESCCRTPTSSGGPTAS